MDRELSFNSRYPQNSKRPLILIVDDDEDNLLMMSLALELWGYGYLTATTGRKALELTQTYLPDLIMLDIVMPDYTGLEVVDYLQQNYQTKHIPILILTALPQEQYRERLLNAGARDYLTKPCSIEKLEATIHQLIYARCFCCVEDR